VGSGIGVGKIAIPSSTDDLAVVNHDGADGNITGFERALGGTESFFHPEFVVGRWWSVVGWHAGCAYILAGSERCDPQNVYSQTIACYIVGVAASIAMDLVFQVDDHPMNTSKLYLLNWLFLSAGFTLAHAAPHQQPATGQSQSAPYAVAGKVKSPRVFAEGIISTVDDEIGGSFSPDGREFYFTRLVPYTTLPRLGIICVSYFRDGRWTTPEVVPFSGRYLDYPPKFDGGSKRLLFASSRPLPDGTRGRVRIWEVERTPTGWGEPRPLPPPVNSIDSFWNGDPSESSDGTLYFSSDRGGGASVHIYRSRLVEGKYSEPEKLGPEINSEFNDDQPYISSDGKLLLFASAGEDTPPYARRHEELLTGGKPYSRGDLYVSVQQDGKWSQARHLGGGINSFAEEEFPFLSPDGRYLFFSSERSPFTVPTAHRLTHDELERHLHSIFNGHGNVFFVDADTLEVKR
jgi:hypothetical protein